MTSVLFLMHEFDEYLQECVVRPLGSLERYDAEQHVVGEVDPNSRDN